MMVVVFTGLPGTGKSTLAERVARLMPAPAFAGDWLMGALAPSGVFASIDRATYMKLYHRLLWTLASRQLMLDQSAVMDCLVTDELAKEWGEQAESLAGRQPPRRGEDEKAPQRRRGRKCRHSNASRLRTGMPCWNRTTQRFS